MQLNTALKAACVADRNAQGAWFIKLRSKLGNRFQAALKSRQLFFFFTRLINDSNDDDDDDDDGDDVERKMR